MVAVGLLAMLGLAQAGCQSGGCTSCGLLKRTTARIFNRSSTVFAGGGCCGGSAGESIVSDAPMSYGGPSSVVIPGPSGSSVSPTIEDSPSTLDPIPPKATIDKGASAKPTKSSYDTASPGYRSGRPRASSNGLARGSTGSPASASRPLRGIPLESQVDDDNPLDRLPPLDLPTEVTERSQTPPIAPVADKSATAPKGDSSTGSKGQETSTKEPGKSAGSPLTLPLEAANSASGVPGIRRLVSVDLKLAGGSTPTNEGLDFLAEKGYKTLLDLREVADVQPSFISEVDRRGMRYIAMPLSAKKLDADHVSRFNFELSSAEVRPLFFFDSDGSRPGALWYVRRITKDNVDPQIARREADEIGLTDKAFWLAATSYVEKSQAAKVGQLPADGEIDAETVPASATGIPAASPPKSPSASAAPNSLSPDVADLARSITLMASTLPKTETATSTLAVDTSRPFKIRGDWHPLAAVMMTGLTVPLAYWTRSMFPLIFTKPSASLPATGPQSKSLPPASGE